MEDFIRQTRGAASDKALLLFAVAFVGVTGFFGLGHAYEGALVGSTEGEASTPSVATSSQAGVFQTLRRLEPLTEIGPTGGSIRLQGGARTEAVRSAMGRALASVATDANGLELLERAVVTVKTDRRVTQPSWGRSWWHDSDGPARVIRIPENASPKDLAALETIVPLSLRNIQIRTTPTRSLAYGVSGVFVGLSTMLADFFHGLVTDGASLMQPGARWAIAAGVAVAFGAYLDHGLEAARALHRRVDGSILSFLTDRTQDIRRLNVQDVDVVPHVPNAGDLDKGLRFRHRPAAGKFILNLPF
ncbi:MAG: hypothetical protein KC416_13460, partial [Myxococcales bacterium]|nr:hypothetical protein [Myxococcales bacterium]